MEELNTLTVGIAHLPTGEDTVIWEVAMSTAAGFEPMIEVTSDDRARIPFGRVGVHRNERFLVSRNAAGEILLTPMASIPRRELLIWENQSVRESLQRGLDDVGQGRIGPMDLLNNDE